jgi:hypothetical protein
VSQAKESFALALARGETKVLAMKRVDDVALTTHHRFRRDGSFEPPELPGELEAYGMPVVVEGVGSRNIHTELDCANVADIPSSSTVAGD